MSDERFWALIDSSLRFADDPEAQVEFLQSALEKLPEAEIVAFRVRFDEQMKRAYSWDLWGAAYVALGGASDDGFEYFRCWLISRGSDLFEKVLADPDSLADLLPDDVDQSLEFEEFAYVAADAWSAKAGRPLGEMPDVEVYDSAETPKGKPFDEDPDYLEKRYPKLSKRFGD